MIRPLRIRHLRVVAALAIAVPLLLVAAMGTRPTIPRATGLPPGLVAAAGAPGPILGVLRGGASGHAIVATLASIGDSGDRAVSVAVEGFESLPELLVYWSVQAAAADGRWTEEARLLGAIDRGRTAFLPLPAAARASPGHLVVYDLAHGEPAGQLELPAGSPAER